MSACPSIASVFLPSGRNSPTAGTFGTVVERDAGDAAKDAVILQKLGKTGWQRLYEFRTYYTQGWGEGDGQPVSPTALEALYTFLEGLEVQPGMVPSIYLLRDGSLGLAWEDTTQNEIEVCFRPREIRYYRGSDETELEFTIERAAELGRMANRLSSNV
jgi:hypothetical protein